MRSSRVVLVLAAVLVAIALAPVPGRATSSSGGSTQICAGSLSVHSQPHLANLEGTASATAFYARPEHQDVPALVAVTPAESCTQDPNDFAEPGRAFYRTFDGSAVAADEDYEAIPQTLTDSMCIEAGQVPPHDPCPPGVQATDPVNVMIGDDEIVEPAVESFRFVLTRDPSSTPLNASRPREAAVHIIDNDGAARVSLEPTLDGQGTMQYEPKEQAGHYHIPVFWAGPSGPSGSVPYTIGPVGGFPSPTLGEDYLLLSQNPLPAGDFSFGGGRIAFIRLRILNDNQAELDEAISITLTGSNAEADRDTTTVTIRDAGVDTFAPRTNFHHPKHKKRYTRNAYQLREMHVFYKDPGGSGIKRVQLAIQRRMNNGRCQWWNGKRFRGGSCNGVPSKSWRNTKYESSLDWFLYRVPAFKPTQGTNLRFYRAFARGFDLAGNVESLFQKGRNKNTFWVKRS